MSAPDSHILGLANYAAGLANERSTSPYHTGLNAVMEAHTQVVAGVKYRVKFTTGPTNCLKRVKYPASSCTVDRSRVC